MSKKLTVQYSKLSPSALLKLMQQGIEVKLPTGFVFSGDVENQYIDIGYDLGTGRMIKDGCWGMNLAGMKSAIADAKRFEKDNIII